MQNLPIKFENYLKNKGVSPKSLRNYRADLKHFLAWSGRTHWSAPTTNFSGQLVGEYKGLLIESKTPEATINRRLSTLRNYARFLLAEGVIAEDPTRVVNNVRRDLNREEQAEKILASFANHLQEEGVKPATLKNYLSDVRQFLIWIPRPQR